MMTRISSAITQLMRVLSGVAEWPAVLSAAASTFWSGPSILTAVAPSPIVVTTGEPAAPSSDLKDRPCLVRKSLVLSQSENLLHGPTKLWNLQLAVSAGRKIRGLFEHSSCPTLM